MNQEWNIARIQGYIDNETEESTEIEYKGSGSIDNPKNRDIAKDVSAMANSAGGLIFYGIKEFDETSKQHKPEKIDPVDRTLHSKEWLEHVITSNIQPKIKGLKIYPVEIELNKVVYVVEILQSSTAHQVAKEDFRYYERLNFENKPMEDYRIRDVMNRATHPDADVEFSYKTSNNTDYLLKIKIINKSNLVVNHYKLEFSFPNLKEERTGDILKFIDHFMTVKGENVILDRSSRGQTKVIYYSKNILFPKDEIDISREIPLEYHINDFIYSNLLDQLKLQWILYADNMVPKFGVTPIPHNF